MNSDQQNTTWHTLEAEQVAAQLRVDVGSGLTGQEAASRLRADGPNDIVETARRSPWRILLGQFADFMILVLIAAAIISGMVGSPEDAVVIVVIVILNALVGAIQEYRAERAIVALRLLATPAATVWRDGVAQTVSTRDLVAGDVVSLEAGNVVPADLRLIQCEGLEVNEAALSGESLTVMKATVALPAAATGSLGDRTNMAYKGTQVTRGRASGIVVATGMATELGQNASPSLDAVWRWWCWPSVA
jgi:Ca2+-transporting ATPase